MIQWESQSPSLASIILPPIIDTNALLLQLDDAQHLTAVRTSIGDLLLMALDHRRDILDAWEAAHLVDSIGALSLNVHALRQPTSAWLRLCLKDLELALMPQVKRPLFQDSIALEQLTYIQLREAVEAIAIELDYLSRRAEEDNA